MYIKRFVKHYYIMLVPALLWLFFFSIVPMFGIVMAFQDYNPGQGILHSKFVGLANFKYMFQMSDITQVLRNTVVIALGKIIGNIIFPLVFALLLNELAFKKLKRPIQTIVYLPYFLSWVILAKIVLNIFGYTGPVNQIIGYIMSGDPTYITSHKGARSMIMKVERDELVEELLNEYIKNKSWER